jgi:hypothetical protein
MMRLVFWCLIGVLLYSGLRKLTGGGSGGKPGAGGPNVGTGRAEDMVRCRVCGLNLPKSEALAVGGQWACCAQHASQSDPGKPT